MADIVNAGGTGNMNVGSSIEKNTNEGGKTLHFPSIEIKNHEYEYFQNVIKCKLM